MSLLIVATIIKETHLYLVFVWRRPEVDMNHDMNHEVLVILHHKVDVELWGIGSIYTPRWNELSYQNLLKRIGMIKRDICYDGYMQKKSSRLICPAMNTDRRWYLLQLTVCPNNFSL